MGDLDAEAEGVVGADDGPEERPGGEGGARDGQQPHRPQPHGFGCLPSNPWNRNPQIRILWNVHH